MASNDTDPGENVLVALAGGASYSEAAAASGLSKRTIARRMASASFRSEVARLRAELGLL